MPVVRSELIQASPASTDGRSTVRSSAVRQAMAPKSAKASVPRSWTDVRDLEENPISNYAPRADEEPAQRQVYTFTIQQRGPKVDCKPIYGGRDGLGHRRTVELQLSFVDGVDVFEGHKVNFAAFIWAAKLGKDLIQVTLRTPDGQSPIYYCCIVESYQDPIGTAQRMADIAFGQGVVFAPESFSSIYHFTRAPPAASSARTRRAATRTSPTTTSSSRPGPGGTP
jgi:hypothetical protein